MSKRKETPQEQILTTLTFLDGTTADAIRTGNNAAWLCPCGRKLPLVGYSDAEKSNFRSSHVACPKCGRTYKVLAPSLRGTATAVKEIKPTVNN